MSNQWKERKVLIIGAARQGLALARFLAAQGAKVTLNDKQKAQEMQPAIKAMRGYPVNWHLGHHDLALLEDIDLICISGGIPLTLPIIVEAKQREIPISNDSQIFMENVPCKVVGITGSAGKTTTTTLVGRMAEHAVRSPIKAWIGGNIGLPLIDVVDQIKPDDIAVLEFSSFQLELMDRSPDISAVLNVTPNHLDRHGSMETYTAIKSRIFEYQEPEGWTILGREDPGAWALRASVPGNLASFGLNPVNDFPCAFVRGSSITLFDGRQSFELMPVENVLLRGRHNLLNVLAACSIAQAAGFSADAIRAGIIGFEGVPHRLEFVRKFQGADWYNDSKATTPEGSIAAIQAFEDPLIVLLGGRDKHLPWENLATLIHERVEHVIAFGEAADIVVDAIRKISERLQSTRKLKSVERCVSLQDAVRRAAEIAEPGFVVLLAPGGTSFDEFNNFEERGERFKQWVNKLS